MLKKVANKAEIRTEPLRLAAITSPVARVEAMPGKDILCDLKQKREGRQVPRTPHLSPSGGGGGGSPIICINATKLPCTYHVHTILTTDMYRLITKSLLLLLSSPSSSFITQEAAKYKRKAVA